MGADARCEVCGRAIGRQPGKCSNGLPRGDDAECYRLGYERAKRQRDDLLAALKAARPLVDKAEDAGADPAPVLAQIDAAIAAAEGQSPEGGKADE